MLKLQEVSLFCLTVCLIHVSVRCEDSKDTNIAKRAPGWGKRSSGNELGYIESVLSDYPRYDADKDDADLETAMVKRRPGWGKRNYGDDFDLDKRKPGWGKRTSGYSSMSKRRPGWGKRAIESDSDYFEDEMTKRRPGWGKRTIYDSDAGPSKRAPGWGKRAPGWGKRSDDKADTVCKELVDSMRILRLKLAQMEDEYSGSCTPYVFLAADAPMLDTE